MRPNTSCQQLTIIKRRIDNVSETRHHPTTETMVNNLLCVCKVWVLISAWRLPNLYKVLMVLLNT